MLSLSRRHKFACARPVSRRARVALACALACLAAASWGAGRSSAAGCSAPSFRPRPVYPLGTDARALAAADFNADGKLDLVGVSFGAGQITVFLNDGTGTQAVGTNYEAGRNPIAAAAADFNGDGKPDLAVADNSPARVAVLLNNGSGGFGPTAYTNSGGGSPRWLAPGDFNRDGKVDLAVANEFGGVAILLGNGAGGFTVSATYDAGQQPQFVLVSDFNNDAKQDLAVGIIGSAQIFLGDGAGAFARQPDSCATVGGDGLAAGDLNGDGRVDLVAGGSFSDHIFIALGNGAGCFGASTSHRTANDRPNSVHLADFNSDGKLDALTDATLSLGDGTGEFGPPTQFDQSIEFSPPAPWASVPGDFDGDGRLDAATVRSGPTGGPRSPHGLTVFFGDGAGGFKFTTGLFPTSIAAADFNKDGKADLVTADAGQARLSLFVGDGAGGYASPVPVPLSNSTPVSVRASDLNGDANPDLVVLRASPRSVVVLRGDGAGGFSAPATFALTLSLSNPTFFELADLNGDGKVDAVASDQSSNFNVLLGAGDGSFAAPTSFTTNTTFIGGMELADFNADGRPDLALSASSPSSQNRIAVLPGNGAGGFGAAVTYPSGGTEPRDLAAGDFNGDGKTDVLVANSISHTVSLLPGDGAGGLGQPASFATGPEPSVLAFADFNGDGKADVATANASPESFDNVSVLLGDGAGQFGPPAHYATEARPRALIAADLNADGMPDLATANTEGNSFSVLLNSCSGAPSAASVQFGSPSYTVNEDATTAVVTVRRTGDLSGAAAVDYATVDDPAAVRCDDIQTMIGVAFARCDYATAVGTVRFAPGEAVKTFTVSIINDAHTEPDELVRLVLRNAAGAAIGSQHTATLLIAEDFGGGQNPIDNHTFFVRQQYLDFLSREPEPSGLQSWLNVLNGCPNTFNHDPAAPSALCDRNLVSSAFFRSQEFQFKGLYVFRFYRVAFNRLPRYVEIIPDMSGLAGQTPEEVFQKRAQFANEWVARPEFQTAFGAATNAQLVNALMDRYGLQSIRTPNPQTPDDQNAKITITRQELIDRLNSNAYTRAQVVRAVADSEEVDAAEFRRAFVAMQYFGYLRRDPDEGGFNNWLAYLNANPSDFYTMVNGFLYSQEYRLRFGPVN